MSKENMGFGTKAIHAGLEPDSATGAVMTPIYQTSTFAMDYPNQHKGYEYSRIGNPTRKALEDNIAALENGKFGMVFGSGLAAIDAILKVLKPGDEVLSTQDLYGGSYRLFKKIFEKYDINFSFVDTKDLDQIEASISENTKMIWLETPSNPTLQITDIKAICERVKTKDIKVVVDNTFASPYLQNPLDLGADVVMHSITKYLAGHSDVVLGALITNDASLAEELYFIQNTSGAIGGPQDCFLALRGIKTLHLRMQRHCENAKEVAHYLSQHPKVDQVYWPGLENHLNHDIAKKQMKDFGGMLSFSLKGNSQKSAFDLMASFKLITLAESLGGVESLCCHSATMTHGAVPKEERERLGIVDSLIRLSIGIEDIEDIKADLEQALILI